MKNIFSLILVLSLAISVLCCPVLAADGDPEDEQSFWEKVTGKLTEIVNTLTGGFTGLATNIGEKISTYSDNIKLGIVEFKDNAIGSFRSVISWLTSISNSLDTRLKQVVDWFGDINSTITSKLNSVVSWLKDLHSTFASKLASTVSWLGDINDTLSDNFNTLWARFSEFSLKDALQEFFERPVGNPTPDVSIDEELGKFDDDFADLDSSMDDISDFLNNSFDSFVEYASGFLFVIAFFNALTTIPVFEFLLNLSLSLGLLGLSLNLMSTIVSKAHKRGG